MSKMLSYVKSAIKTYPILTNSAIYGTLFVGAEFSQQLITKKIQAVTPEAFDKATIIRYALYGTTIQGPLLTVWYRWLDGKFVGTSLKLLSKKLFVDQFLMTPHLLVIFYVAMSIMEQKQDIFEECRKKFIPTFQSSCLFWLPAQTINFLLIPPMFRVVYVGSCSCVWVNILCWLKNKNY